MYEILMIVYLVVALALVGFILVQQGKGAGMGSSFGAGASGTVFGAGGSGNFLTKTTTILAVIFFGVALGLGNLTIEKSATPEEDSLFATDGVENTRPATDIPATDTSAELPVVEAVVEELPTDGSVSGDLPKEEELPTTTTENSETEPKKDDGTN